MKRVVWALDSGFEHIEIDEKKLIEGDGHLYPHQSDSGCVK